MTDLRVTPIVEGHGDVAATRILLDRTWREIVGGDYLDVLRPIRVPRSLVARDVELLRRVDLACLKLADAAGPAAPRLVLLMIDADPELGCEIAPRLRETVEENRPDVDMACAFPDPEYETWFVAAAEPPATSSTSRESRFPPIQTGRAAARAGSSGLFAARATRRPSSSHG